MSIEEPAEDPTYENVLRDVFAALALPIAAQVVGVREGKELSTDERRSLAFTAFDIADELMRARDPNYFPDLPKEGQP